MTRRFGGCETPSYDEHLGVLCVLHQPDLAVRHAHRLVGLRRGKLAFNVPVAEVDLDAIAALYRLDEA